MERSLSILVIDDEFDVAEVLAELLTDRGHRVTTAINGMVGQTLMSSNDYDLVITDFMMPIVDGIQLVEGMRSDRRLAGVPVILISAQSELPPGIRGRLVQATLQKPFSPEALYAAIREVTGVTAPPRGGRATR